MKALRKDASGHLRNRFKTIVEILKHKKLEALLLNSQSNVSYAAGFHAPDACMLISEENLTLITDFRYAADFQRQKQKLLRVIEEKGSIFETIIRAIKNQKLKTIGFESRHLSWAEHKILRDLAKKETRFVPLEKTLEPLREVKDQQELQSIRKALKITLKTYKFVEKILKPGLKEIEVAAQIERFIRLEGAGSSAFETIVASGPNSSYPHARVSQRRLRQGDPVVIDMGVDYEGYKCDLTRTFFLGKIKPAILKVAEIIRQAQNLAIDAIRPGAVISEIDLSARQFITQKGFGQNFGHSLGHGVGLEVHESPSINQKNHRPLKKGAVVTVEPGIYIPGAFGVRIEDMVLVTQDGAEVLSDNDRH